MCLVAKGVGRSALAGEIANHNFDRLRAGAENEVRRQNWCSKGDVISATLASRFKRRGMEVSVNTQWRGAI